MEKSVQSLSVPKLAKKNNYNEHLISIGNTVTRISKKCNNE